MTDINRPPKNTDLWLVYENGEREIGQYREERQCMLGSRAGEFGPGYVSKDAGGLPVDGVVAWEHVTAQASKDKP